MGMEMQIIKPAKARQNKEIIPTKTTMSFLTASIDYFEYFEYFDNVDCFDYFDFDFDFDCKRLMQ